jgi:DNA repair protein RadC
MRTVRRYVVQARRVPLVRESDAPAFERHVRRPHDAEVIARCLLEHEAQEVFVALHFNVHNRLLGYTEVGRGGFDSCPVDPRVLFRDALLLGASAVIVAHNHPSGEPEPSTEDYALTQRLKAAGDLIGVQLLDHLIVGEHRLFSFCGEGAL